MERQNGATYEAYDGVELRLLNGCVVRCPALTVREAVRYLRLLSRAREDAEANAAFLAEFPGRMNLEVQRLVDLGVAVEGADLGELRYKDGVRLAKVLALASYHPDVRKRSKAQVAFLRLLPKKLGLDPDSLQPHEVMELGRRLVDDMYETMYGLAEDFCSHLTSSPPVKVMTLRRAQTVSSSTWASTT